MGDVRRSLYTRAQGLTVLVAIFGLLTVAVTWPLAASPYDLLGRIGEPGEPVFMGDATKAVGYLARGARASAAGESLWGLVLSDTRVHAPPGYVFVGSWLARLLGSPILAHNVMLFASVFLAFLCMYGFVRYLTQDRVAALFSAVVFGTANQVVHSALYGHLNQIQIFWFPLGFWAIERVLVAPSWRTGAALGVVLGCVSLWVAHFAVFLGVLLPLYGFLRAPRRVWSLDVIEALAVGAVVAVAMCGHYVLSFSAAGPVERTLEANLLYSLPSAASLLNPDWHGHIGAVPILLAVSALFAPPRVVARGRVLGFAAVVLVSIAMALGPKSPFHPYSWFFEAVPAFNLMRTPVRFIYPGFAACVVLAGFGIHWLRVAPLRSGTRGLLVSLAFAGSLLVTPLFGTWYTDRAREPDAIWTVEVETLPRYRQAIQR